MSRQLTKCLIISVTVFLAVFLLSGCDSNYTTSQQNGSSNTKNVQQSQQQSNRNTEIQTQQNNPTTTSCGSDYYKNVDGNCVHRPSNNCEGATAVCRDGSCSFSQHRQGTCSGHGGVAQWL